MWYVQVYMEEIFVDTYRCANGLCQPISLFVWMLKLQSLKKEIPLQEETNSVTWVYIDKGALFSLALMLSYHLSNGKLFLHPSLLDSISSSIFIGYSDMGSLLVLTKEFGTVNWHTFCLRAKEYHTQVLMESQNIMAFPVNSDTSTITTGSGE